MLDLLAAAAGRELELRYLTMHPPQAIAATNPLPPPLALKISCKARIVIPRAPNTGVKSRWSVGVTIEQEPNEWGTSDSE